MELHMNKLLIALIVGSFGIAAQAQEHNHAAPATAASSARPGAPAEHPPEIFCGTMKTGQLCSMGTVTLLGLTPEKREAWLTAVRAYNKVVNDAIVTLQAQAKGTLSAAQVEEVNRWFAVGVNPQINQLLTATANAREVKR
jgi:hypothetical protein